MPALGEGHHTDDCYLDNDLGGSYRGTVAKGVDGRECQKWSLQGPHKHHYFPSKYTHRGIGDHNYCRNPGPEADAEGIFVSPDAQALPSWTSDSIQSRLRRGYCQESGNECAEHVPCGASGS